MKHFELAMNAGGQFILEGNISTEEAANILARIVAEQKKRELPEDKKEAEKKKPSETDDG